LSRWLVDASVLLACEDADDVNHQPAVKLLTGSDSVATVDLAYYEVTNVATVAWHDPAAAHRLLELIEAVGADGGLVRASESLLTKATQVATTHGISVFDATYVVAASLAGAELVSCDRRDLVSNGLARLPADALRET
jgi:predicted nucleic acid-binding protein